MYHRFEILPAFLDMDIRIVKKKENGSYQI